MTGFRRIPPWAAATGVAITVLGTFLPWFHSGTVERHSYQAAALAGRFGLLGNTIADGALRIWVAIPLASAVCLGLFALGFARTAAALTTLLAISVGTVALLATVRSGGGTTGITTTGPVTTLSGAIVALAGALGTFAVRSRPTMRTGENR
ncbi:hypothetical protein [Amycolatopsis pithecellobii]|uniref:Uncharacterized protein n=1 Tax=Amycolatopsis pithecellobii TaxID=664692 RepID=A0A6N7Z6X0_9PSEU|nr:hypothetical protein [Amycolatopsis pithecellobii]MTD56791.1 hypothetical protein [Amycolatopsis pithecellobii]